MTIQRLIKGALAVLGVAGVVTVWGLWIVFGVNTPAYEGERSVKILPDASFEAVVDSLEAGGILQRRSSFTRLAALTGWKDQIKPGYYAFESGRSNYDLLSTLRRGLQTPVRLTIPPGTSPDVLASAVARKMNFEKEDFLAALRDSALAVELGTDTLHLFAYMLPETYFVYWLTDAPDVVRKIKGEFDAFFTPTMKASADSMGLTVDEVLRVASIVDWETNHEAEKPRVAGVYLNRLRRGWRLDADPTVQYALIELEGARRRLLYRDYQIEHPFNTYRYRGLPPGPVNNPTPSAIESVVYSEEHPYMFFVATGDGRHTFSRTLSEHRRAARAFQRMMQERRRQQAADGQD